MALRYFSSFVSVVCKMDFHVPKDVWPVLRFVLSKLRVYRLRDGVLYAEGRMAEIHFRSVRAERGLCRGMKAEKRVPFAKNNVPRAGRS